MDLLPSIAIGTALGILSGLLSGLVGVGGGVVIIPVLVFLLGYSQHLAQGTALLAFSLPVFGLAAWNYYKYKRVNWIIALGVSAGIALASFFVAEWVQTLKNEVLTKIFGAFLILIAVWQFWRAGHKLSGPTSQKLPSRTSQFLIGLGVGLLTGALKGLTGLGGGVIIVPFLILLAKLDQHTAQGTSLLSMTLPVSLITVIPYWQHGNVEVPVGLSLAVGITIGSTLSARFAQKIAGPNLARIFAIVVGIMGVVILVR